MEITESYETKKYPPPRERGRKRPFMAAFKNSARRWLSTENSSRIAPASSTGATRPVENDRRVLRHRMLAEMDRDRAGNSRRGKKIRRGRKTRRSKKMRRNRKTPRGKKSRRDRKTRKRK